MVAVSRSYASNQIFYCPQNFWDYWGDFLEVESKSNQNDRNIIEGHTRTHITKTRVCMWTRTTCYFKPSTSWQSCWLWGMRIFDNILSIGKPGNMLSVKILDSLSEARLFFTINSYGQKKSTQTHTYNGLIHLPTVSRVLVVNGRSPRGVSGDVYIQICKGRASSIFCVTPGNSPQKQQKPVQHLRSRWYSRR